MTDWVPLMAPPELAARFLREVAEFVGRSDAAEARLWEDATGADIKTFIAGLNEPQYRFVVDLAFAERPATAAVHAERAGMTIDDVAGVVGPVNKRAKKLGWVSPIRSHRELTGTTMEKVVVLDDHVALWIRDHHEED